MTGCWTGTRSRLDIPALRTLFGLKARPHHNRKRGPPAQDIVIEKPQYGLAWFRIRFGRLQLKAYTKGEHVLRFEATVHNTKELRCRRSLENFAQIITLLHVAGMADRFATTLDCADIGFLPDGVLTEAAAAGRPGGAGNRGRLGLGRAIAHRLAAEGACVVVADLNAESAASVAADIGSSDVAAGVTMDVSDEKQVAAAFAQAALAFGGVDLVVNSAGLSISKPLAETTLRDWDLQHDVMARGSFLVSREAARVMRAQGRGGDIVYVASKNSVAAGPSNVAYGAAKADQAHQVRLLAAELGADGIRVNGINPDGVVRGSGIFAGGWGARRAEVYGVPEEELGAYYAQRTLLKKEVLPEHIASAVFALTGGDLSLTTGLHIPVDAGVAAAFLR